MSPLATYQALQAKGVLVPDDAQEAVMKQLDELYQQLRWWQLFAKPRGIYIYGDVGRGKSMVMDLFFASLPAKRKTRIHFHAFMQQTHELIHGFRQSGQDPIASVAREVARQTRVLCFDEFQVKDIADASILQRLFTALFASGVVMVLTSNTPPQNLYEGGLHRTRFLPFIDVLTQHLRVVPLQGERDYRHRHLKGQPVWFSPLDDKAQDNMNERFATLTAHTPPTQAEIVVAGRCLTIPQAAQGVMRFDFDTLCQTALGAGDYLALAHHFHTLMLDGIPTLNDTTPDVVLRFVHLIDALYENKVKLLASCATKTQGIYQGQRYALEMKRATSQSPVSISLQKGQV